jgi:hypothetical protein
MEVIGQSCRNENLSATNLRWAAPRLLQYFCMPCLYNFCDLLIYKHLIIHCHINFQSCGGVKVSTLVQCLLPVVHTAVASLVNFQNLWDNGERGQSQLLGEKPGRGPFSSP